jgi:hypothetical protein
MTTGPAMRDALAAAALADIPKLLTLLDRTPTSATYGCFDRAYWHYRMMDFPSGMSQEFVLPLALAWALPIPGNPYYQAPAIRDWVSAGIRFAATAAHGDGSCDDYYPFERAAGATAFSLYACLEAIRLTDLACDPQVADFLRRRVGWLAGHRESGRLSNHEALIIACLARMEEREPGSWDTALRERVARLLSWQSGEGWFDEYGGADPGYLSLTIGLLAEVDRRRPDLGLRAPLGRAIDFFAAVLHPDGGVGGEYASRGTLNFFPHGFEIAAGWRADAAAINDRALRPLAEGRQPCYADDHIVGHHLWSWLMTWAEWRDARPEPVAPPTTTRRFDEARLLIDVHGETRLHLAWSRGGAFKLFDGDTQIVSDTGPALATDGGRSAVTHLEGPVEVSIEADRVTVAGRMAWSRSTLLTPAKSVVLRLVMLSAGRFFPDLVRRLLQRILVTGRRDAPFAFRRDLVWHDGGWTITDTITPERGWDRVRAIGIGNAQTSTTTIMARVWQPAQLASWIDLTDRLIGLTGATPLVVTRRLTR